MQGVFEENGISAEMIEGNDTLVRKIKGYADAVPDYRHPSYVKHLLGDIIMITFFAILGNADEWGESRVLQRKKKNGSKNIWNFHMESLQMTLSVL